MAKSLTVNDWKFVAPSTAGSAIAVDLFLDNGQHSRLEVFPMFYPHGAGEHIPEVIVYCERSGEKLNRQQEFKRWLSRPPDKDCPWSQVELSPTLVRQLNERLVGTLE